MLSWQIQTSEAVGSEVLKQQIRDAFATVKNEVERQVNGEAAESDTAPAPGNADNHVAGNGTISEKQAKFALSLAAKKGLSVAELNGHIAQTFGVTGLYDLTKKQASRSADQTQKRTFPRQPYSAKDAQHPEPCPGYTHCGPSAAAVSLLPARVCPGLFYFSKPNNKEADMPSLQRVPIPAALELFGY